MENCVAWFDQNFNDGIQEQMWVQNNGQNWIHTIESSHRPFSLKGNFPLESA